MKQLLSFIFEIHPLLFRLKIEKQIMCCGTYGSAKIRKMYIGPFMIGIRIPAGKYGEGLR